MRGDGAMEENMPKRVLEGEVISGGERRLRMPAETPWGLGFLGEARFEALRRVIDARERTLQAVIRHIDAESEVDRAMVRRAEAADELRHVGAFLRAKTAERQELAEVASLKRLLDKLELQEKIATAENRLNKAKGLVSEPKPAAKPSEYDEFLSTLSKIPGIVAATEKVKEEILRQAGGEENLTPEKEDLLSSINAMLQEFIARQGEKAR